MLCENCGKNEANVKYTQIINGEERKMNLCEECSEKLGITSKLDFNMPLDFSNFFGDFLKEFEETPLMPKLICTDELRCNNCNMTFDEFIEKGKFGCSNCYDAFKEEIDPILKKIHGGNRHIGRLGKIKEGIKLNNVDAEKKESTEIDEITKLKQELKEAVQKEDYEHAAQLRDQIKKLEN